MGKCANCGHDEQEHVDGMYDCQGIQELGSDCPCDWYEDPDAEPLDPVDSPKYADEVTHRLSEARKLK